MRIVCIGDSLTEGDYGVFGKHGIANVHAENYPYFLAALTGAETVNAGKCGYTASAYLQYYTAGHVDVHAAAVILIMLGTNGGLDPEGDTQGNRDFCTLLELCHRDAPTARLVLCTPPHATENPAMSNCGYAPQVAAAAAFVRKTAQARGMALIDLAACPAFTAENESIMQPNDGLHYGETGYQTMAAFIADSLHALYPTIV